MNETFNNYQSNMEKILLMYGGRAESYDVTNHENGITRKKNGKQFTYYYIKNDNEVSKKDLDRINKLRIPPAWTNVWISIDSKSKIQVIGEDIKGKKQYIYHTEHVLEAERQKFIRLQDFVKSLPQFGKIVDKHMKLPHYNKLKTIAIMLTIVKKLHIRVGKEQYAKQNKSYGISSLEKRHMKLEGDYINFRFKGKSKQILSYRFHSPTLRPQLQLLLKLEGDKLFQYIDFDEKIKRITDTDLNQYIQQHMGEQFTVKDFRTYAANYHFLNSLIRETLKRSPKNQKAIKKNLLNAQRKTSNALRHTESISKKSYVMNFIRELYQNNPEIFIKLKNDDVDDILLSILKMYASAIHNSKK